MTVLLTSRAVSSPSYRRYWLSLYRRDLKSAGEVVDQALTVWAPQRVYLRLFEPALNLSGTLWARGTITHSDEHFVTHHTLQFMRKVRRRFAPAETYGPLAIATGVGQESHLIGLRMVCDFLHWANWRTHWMSSNDRGVVGGVVSRLRPQAVLLSIGQDRGIPHAQRLVAHLRRTGFDGLIAVGGLAVQQQPSIVTTIGADLTAPNGLILVRALRSRFPTRARVDAQ